MAIVPNAAHPLLTTAMTKAAFDAAVIQERNWELVFENCDRWFDICRKRILDDPNVTVRESDRANFSEDDYLFPIPETDLRLNKLLEQNPGYPTSLAGVTCKQIDFLKSRWAIILGFFNRKLSIN